MVRVYESIWAVIALIAAAVAVTGNMTTLVAVAFGFVVFGMIFAGMMMVLPATVAHRNHSPEPEAEVEKKTHYIPSGAVHAR